MNLTYDPLEIEASEKKNARNRQITWALSLTFNARPHTTLKI